MMSQGISTSAPPGATYQNIRRIFAQTVTRLRGEGALAEAEFFARAHLAFLQDELGHEDAAIETAIANLAELLTAQGKMVAARALVRRLIDLRAALYGPAHPLVEQARSVLERLGEVP